MKTNKGLKRTPISRGTKQLKRTPLKRGNNQLKHDAIKFKPKRYPVPKEELAKVDERAGGKCEYHDNTGMCVGKLVYAHIRHRKLGGAQGKMSLVINNHRNMTKVCSFIHDVIDNRIFDWKSADESRGKVIEFLKSKIGWHEWYEENEDILNGNV